MYAHVLLHADQIFGSNRNSEKPGEDCSKGTLNIYIFTVDQPQEHFHVQLKDECRSDHSKMQAALPAMLKQEGIQKFVFTPVYNPR